MTIATSVAVLLSCPLDALVVSLLDEGGPISFAEALLSPGSEGWIRRLAIAVAVAGLGLALDATLRLRAAEARLRRLGADLEVSAATARLAEKVFEHTVEGIVVTDPDGTIVMVNPSFSAITGYSAEEAIGRNPRMLQSERHDTAFYERMWASVLTAGQWSGEIWNRKKSGEAYPEWLNISAIRDGRGRTTHFVAVFHDLSDIKRDQLAIQHQAQHDPLTGLPNRSLLDDRMRVAVSQARRQGSVLAVVFVDLDDFKAVNDTRGHAAGDRVLQHVAGLLRGCVRDDDTVARLGGDEFVILLTALDDPSGAVRVVQCAQQGLRRALPIGDLEIEVTASFGLSFFPTDGSTAEVLLRKADLAMYRAKQLGKNGLQLYAAGPGAPAAGPEAADGPAATGRAPVGDRLEPRAAVDPDDPPPCPA